MSRQLNPLTARERSFRIAVAKLHSAKCGARTVIELSAGARRDAVIDEDEARLMRAHRERSPAGRTHIALVDWSELDASPHSFERSERRIVWNDALDANRQRAVVAEVEPDAHPASGMRT